MHWFGLLNILEIDSSLYLCIHLSPIYTHTPTHPLPYRKRNKDAFQDKHGVKLGFMSAFVAASTKALQEIPSVNGSVDGNGKKREKEVKRETPILTFS